MYFQACYIKDYTARDLFPVIKTMADRSQVYLSIAYFFVSVPKQILDKTKHVFIIFYNVKYNTEMLFWHSFTNHSFLSAHHLFSRENGVYKIKFTAFRMQKTFPFIYFFFIFDCDDNNVAKVGALMANSRIITY